MMYPRLFLARNLLKDEGVVMVSINDMEASRLRLVLDEVFGEESFVAQFVWNNEGNIDQQSDRLPTDPGRDTESIGVDDLIEFQPIRNDPPRIEYAATGVDWPTCRDQHESASHMRKAPERQRPQSRATQDNRSMHEPDEPDQNHHDHDVEYKFDISTRHGSLDRNAKITRREQGDRPQSRRLRRHSWRLSAAAGRPARKQAFIRDLAFVRSTTNLLRGGLGMLSI
jgi:hypothetical protein